MSRALTLSPVAHNPDPTIPLTTIKGVTKSLDDWTTTFHLCLIVLPGRPEASIHVPVAKRILDVFSGADCRTAYLIAGNERSATRVLGEESAERLVFCDPESALVRSLGLTRLPAFVHLNVDTTLVAAAEGWDPKEWNAVASGLATSMRWTKPAIPSAHDPAPSEGWAA